MKNSKNHKKKKKMKPFIQPNFDFIPLDPFSFDIKQNIQEGLESKKHNFEVKLSETSLNEVIENNNPSNEIVENEKQNKISELSEENTKKLLSRASKDISSKGDDEKEFFMRGIKIFISKHNIF